MRPHGIGFLATLILCIACGDDSTGPPPEALAGTWAATFDVLTLVYTSGHAGTHEFDMTLNGDVLTLRGADTDFEFVEGGSTEAAKINLVLVRQ